MLAEYVRLYCPHTKILIHQTWAYEKDSAKLQSVAIDTPEDMLSSLRDAYIKAADSINAYGIIPAGEAMMKATELGIEKIHRDTFHASRGVGRYMLALCWYKFLTGKDISDNRFDATDVPMSEEERQIAINAVNSAFKN